VLLVIVGEEVPQRVEPIVADVGDGGWQRQQQRVNWSEVNVVVELLDLAMLMSEGLGRSKRRRNVAVQLWPWLFGYLVRNIYGLLNVGNFFNGTSNRNWELKMRGRKYNCIGMEM
jgi:hypothetical protein